MSGTDFIKNMTASLKQLDIKFISPSEKKGNYLKKTKLLQHSVEYSDDLSISEKIEALQNPKITSISFHGNKLSTKEKAAIFDKLSKNRTLKELDLAAVQLTQEEAKSLATALEGNQSLEKLDVSANRIKNEGALAILKSNTALKKLSLRFNLLNDDFAKKFPNTRRVQAIEINLAENLITDEGTLAVFDTLNAFSLKSLLIGNGIRDKELRKDITEAEDTPLMDIECTPPSFT